MKAMPAATGHRLAVALALLRVPLAAALRELAARAAQLPEDVLEKKQRQVMVNYADLQYYAYLSVGGQTITGVFDTGSFDLVVFDEACMDCGKAGKYASKLSATFVDGGLQQVFYYGSGSVDVKESFDRVAIGPYNEMNLTFWDTMEASMPVLQNAAFQSIVGVGPPEAPASDAWSNVKNIANSIRDRLNEGPSFPTIQWYRLVSDSLALAMEMSKQPTMIKAMKVTHFSVCLGRKPGSAGYFIWNDTSYLDSPDAFRKVPVLGRHTWTLSMTNMRLHRSLGGGKSTFACEGGCGAIVDSGTSLLLMPIDAAEALKELLDQSGVDCDDLSAVPDLTFELNDHKFSLPADAFVARMTDSLDQSMTSLYRAEFLKLGNGNCQLAVMQSSSTTSWGPLWILGMPFFRNYYTTFQVGRNHSDRAIYVAEASTECTPISSKTMVGRRENPKLEMRTYNRSRMFIPKIVRRALSNTFLDV